MDRNYLKGRDGDRANAVLAAADYNFALLLRWLRRLVRALFQALYPRRSAFNIAKTVAQLFFTDDYPRYALSVSLRGRFSSNEER